MLQGSSLVAADSAALPHIVPTLPKQDQHSAEPVCGLLHLADLDDGHHTLCRWPLSNVTTGSYCKQRDSSDKTADFERTIFARNGCSSIPCLDVWHATHRCLQPRRR